MQYQNLVLLFLFVRLSASLQTISTGCKEEFSRCSVVSKPWQHDGVCLDGKCQVPDTCTLKVSLTVRYSRSKDYETVSDLYIRGSGPGLSWEIPYQMTKSLVDEDAWTAILHYVVDSNGLPCLDPMYCSLNQLYLEFRVYLDTFGEHDMLGPNFFIPLPVSQSIHGALESHVPEFTVYPWFFSTDITSKSMSFVSHSLTSIYGLSLDSFILLPASFYENMNKKYPLLLVMYSGLDIRQLLRHLTVYEASVKEIVIVLFEYKAKSHAEFLPFNISYEPKCKDTPPCYDCNQCWHPKRVEPCEVSEFKSKLKKANCIAVKNYLGKSEALINSIEHELLVEVQKVTESRVLFDFPKRRLTIIGFGDGALTALHAAITRPNVFQNVGCISPKFFLPSSSSLNTYNGMRHILWHEAAKLHENPAKKLLHMTQKFYFDHGEYDDFFFPMGDTNTAMEDIVHILKTQFDLEENVNIVKMTTGGAKLDYENKTPPDMVSRLQLPLLLFFRTAGGPSKTFTRAFQISEVSYAERYNLVVQLSPELFTTTPPSVIGNDTYISILQVTTEEVKNVSNVCEESTGEVPWEVYLGIIG